MNLDIHAIAFHRNGVSGVGFYAIHFTDNVEGRDFIATVFPPDPITTGDNKGEPDWTFSEDWQNPRVAVLALDILPNVAFGENSWRGDNYATDLFRAIVAHEQRVTT